MKKVLFLILFALLLLSACGTKDSAEEQTASEGNQAAETEQNTEEKNVRTPTEEDEKYTELLLERDYETVIKETISFDSESQKDFYNLASALKKHDEITEKLAESAEPNYTDLISDYKVITRYINKSEYIPEEMKAEFDDLRKEAEEKAVEYQAELDKQNQK